MVFFLQDYFFRPQISFVSEIVRVLANIHVYLPTLSGWRVHVGIGGHYCSRPSSDVY